MTKVVKLLPECEMEKSDRSKPEKNKMVVVVGRRVIQGMCEGWEMGKNRTHSRRGISLELRQLQEIKLTMAL